MTISDNDRLLSYIAVRRGVGLEDVATDALSFILNRSDSAKVALSEFLGDNDGPLPIEKVDSQFFLESSWSFPDMALWAAEDNLSAFVEAKFWADLTHNQPVTYWEALPTDRQSVLLFLVPQERVDDDYLWDALVGRLRDAGHGLGPKTRDKNLISASAAGDRRSLMLTSWKHLLQKLADKVERDNDAQAVFEIAELQALASAAVEGRRDTSNDKLKLLLAEAVARLRESGWANTEGRTVGQGFGYYGRYLRLAGAEAWIGTVDEAIKQVPDNLLWLTFYQWEPAQTSINTVNSRLATKAEQMPGSLSWMEVTVPISLPKVTDREATLSAIVEQLVGIAELIDPDGPTYR